jgi:hypothetical protein
LGIGSSVPYIASKGAVNSMTLHFARTLRVVDGAEHERRDAQARDERPPRGIELHP